MDIEDIWSKTWPGRAGIPMERYTRWEQIKFVFRAAFLGYFG